MDTSVLPASCWGCNASSEPRPIGTQPPGGWELRDFEDGIGQGYLCPACVASHEGPLTNERGGPDGQV